MSKGGKSSIHKRPPTKEELTGIAKPQVGRLIVCSKCGLPGGTLVDDGEGGYRHQDQEKCKLLASRKRLTT